MAILTHRTRRSDSIVRTSGTSIREVCLLLQPTSEADLAPGDPVIRAGRAYQVQAAEFGGYVHLRPTAGSHGQ